MYTSNEQCVYCNGTGRRTIPCPDGRPGCCVAHYGNCDHNPIPSALEKRVAELEKKIYDLEGHNLPEGLDDDE